MKRLINWFIKTSAGRGVLIVFTVAVAAIGVIRYTDIPVPDALAQTFRSKLNTDRIIGRDTAGFGDTEEIGVGVSLEFSGTGTIQRAALTGDVTAGANSNATTVAADAVALGADTTGNYVASANTAVLTGLTGGSAGSEAAALSLAFDYTATVGANPALAASACVFGTTGLICEGLTPDGFETLITFADVAADRTYTFPDRSGTAALSGDTFTGDVTGTLNAAGATALTVAADSVALTTDTTGNYVTSVATAVTTGLTGGAAGSEGAVLSLAFDYSQTLAGSPQLAASNCVFGSTGVLCEGATGGAGDAFEALLTFTDPTADRTFTYRDASGTVLISGDSVPRAIVE